MGDSSKFLWEGLDWLGAVFVLGITVSVAAPPIFATERAALMPGEQTTWSAGGDDNEEASSTADEVTRDGMASHNQKSDTAEEDSFDPKKNIIAIHDSSSKQYNKNCGECHAEIHSRQSLDPSISAAHPAMAPFAAGKPGDNRQCMWCHRTVDLTQGTQTLEKSKGNQRRHVDVALCTLCHGPYRDGPGQQFYQSGLSPTDPDGPEVYEVVCAGCHRELGNSELIGKSAEKIQKAIDEDKGGMGVLIVLSTQEIDAIAAVLAEPGGGD
ncbi:MAG: cytochrome c [Acidobacteriota bacterium]|nr:cytochrome c [Acidobacteriota bacterium]